MGGRRERQTPHLQVEMDGLSDELAHRGQSTVTACCGCSAISGGMEKEMALAILNMGVLSSLAFWCIATPYS